jgi:hypothetical protein
MSRRGALCAGLLACLGAGYARASRGNDSTGLLPLISNTIPSTGEKIPAIGLGSDSFRASESDAIRAEIERMHELAASVIDTAAAYGDSEALIGDALEDGKFVGRYVLTDGVTAGTRPQGAAPPPRSTPNRRGRPQISEVPCARIF